MNYRAVLADMPAAVPAYSIHGPDGYTTIVINSRMNYEKQCESYKHEVNHIESDDFDSKRSADEIERDRHI